MNKNDNLMTKSIFGVDVFQPYKMIVSGFTFGELASSVLPDSWDAAPSYDVPGLQPSSVISIYYGNLIKIGNPCPEGLKNTTWGIVPSRKKTLN